ncbi:MAG: hypothetical protein ACRDH9_03050 [Actinomycetota bacterium]
MPSVAIPKHDVRIKGPQGLKRKPAGVVIHTTEGDQRQGPGDRTGIVDFLAGKGICVPWVTDNEGITRAAALDRLGDNHACGLDAYSGVEQIGRAAWKRRFWLRVYRETIRNTGKVVAWELHEAMRVEVNDRTLKRHVFGHADDARHGGCSDHWDPGPGYPYDVMYEDAIAYAAAKGWRVVARKDELRRIRKFKTAKAARAWLRLKARQGWRVVTGKELLKGGEVEDEPKDRKKR